MLLRPWLLVLLIASCRTAGTPPDAAARLQTKGGARGSAAAVTPPPPPSVGPSPAIKLPAAAPMPEDSALAVPLAGFTQAGPEACLPLPQGAVCIGHADPVNVACARVKGEVRRCDDCRTLCSHPLKPAPP